MDYSTSKTILDNHQGPLVPGIQVMPTEEEND